MSTITLELTDASANEALHVPLPTTTNTSEDSEDESLESHRNSSSNIKSFAQCYIQQLKLVFQSIIPDLKSFQTWQILILLLYATFNVVFSFLDFNSIIFRDRQQSLFRWTNEYNQGTSLWRRVLLSFTGISAITNVLNVVLVIRGKMSSYFWGILGAIFYGTFAFANGYAGDAQLFVFFFLPMQFVGIHIWSKELDTKSTARVKSLKLSGWLLIILLSCTFILLFYYEIPMFSKLLTSKYLFEQTPVPHVLDALTNGLSVMGQFLCIARYWEQYIIWTFVNLALIVMYSGEHE
ncbi:unnamed protein product [Adineta ricciae]|uniref:Uncharacterized protein n=1 Tax=Adineta ricciae TaxID=249248 RepID=A0A815QJT4_ADIRI|nr:unnamed protein product [Adineta ricciae]